MTEVFNIKEVQIAISGHPISDLAGDGFKMTPRGEHSFIEGLKGEAGFTLDPMTGVEMTLSLLSLSADNSFLMALWEAQNTVDATDETAIKVSGVDGDATITIPFSIVISSPNTSFQSYFGFSTIEIEKCIISKRPEIGTDGKEAPTYEWSFIGYKLKTTIST